MNYNDRNFWSTLPGILTGFAALLTAGTGLYLGVRGDILNKDSKEELKSSTEILEAGLMEEKDEIFTIKAVINDPDGYTNVRSTPSANAEILARVEKDIPFHTYYQKGNWWQVKTKEGKIGYMYHNRIWIIPD